LKKLAICAAMAVALVCSGARFVYADSYSIPHVLEKSGRITNTQYTFDSQIFAVYSGGAPGIGGGAGATVEIYLFDANTGGPMLSGTNSNVCFPCTRQLTTTTRKLTFNVEDAIVDAGGFDKAVKFGFAVITISGDSENVNLQGFVVNAHTGPFELSVFGYNPERIRSTVAP
jgi:hypothetical protein